MSTPYSKTYECQPQVAGSSIFLVEFRTNSNNALDREVQGHHKIVREISGVFIHADLKYWDYCVVVGSTRIRSRIGSKSALATHKDILNSGLCLTCWRIQTHSRDASIH